MENFPNNQANETDGSVAEPKAVEEKGHVMSDEELQKYDEEMQEYYNKLAQDIDKYEKIVKNVDESPNLSYKLNSTDGELKFEYSQNKDVLRGQSRDRAIDIYMANKYIEQYNNKKGNLSDDGRIIYQKEILLLKADANNAFSFKEVKDDYMNKSIDLAKRYRDYDGEMYGKIKNDHLIIDSIINAALADKLDEESSELYFDSQRHS